MTTLTCSFSMAVTLGGDGLRLFSIPDRSGSARLDGVERHGHRRGHPEVDARVGDVDDVAVPDRLAPLAGQHRLPGGGVDEVEVEDERHPDVAEERDEVPH